MTYNPNQVCNYDFLNVFFFLRYSSPRIDEDGPKEPINGTVSAICCPCFINLPVEKPIDCHFNQRLEP